MASHRPARVLFYVQHLLGIGHLMRACRIALALKEHEFEVTLVTGGMPLPGFHLQGVEQVELPPIAVSSIDFKTLVDDTGKAIDEIFKQRRCNCLLDTYDRIRPDIVLIEAFPFGRRQVRFELLPFIEAIEASSTKPLLFASIRDILQKRSKPGRDEESARLVLAHFDKVLVHGDPDFMPLSSSFSQTAEISDHIVYTGLVSAPPPTNGVTRRYDVVVSAGGGAVGAALVRSSIEAANHLPVFQSWCVIAGPNLAADDYAEIVESAPSHVTVERFRNDFIDLLAGAQLSISQAGYNTVSDVLQSGCQCVLVPFSLGGETEQAARAQRLEDLGMAAVLSDKELTGKNLAAVIQAAMSTTTIPRTLTINADGANNTARLLQKFVNEKRE